jgi:Type I phosphodiesterase / nucleotide pyrophosphatase
MRQITRRNLLQVGGVSAAIPFAAAQQHKTRNVVLVMSDGLRHQEVFGGADAALMNKENGGVADPDRLKERYWRDTSRERREALMPFFWKVIGEQGQVYGNRSLGSEAFVTNGMNFSYPGYNETLTGFADAAIDSNDKKLNRNVTFLEWLNRKPSYRGKVAAFCAWDVFPYILHTERAGLLVNAGHDLVKHSPMSPRMALLNELKAETRIWDAEPLDAFPFHFAMEHLKTNKPRVLFLSLGETDTWAHQGNYANYLHAAHRADNYLKQLWEALQSMPEYRGTTSLVFSPDHGRGEAPVEWKSHGTKIPESKYIWMAFLGPDTPALGERSSVAPVTQSQIAATIVSLLGEDYRSTVPQAGQPISAVLG